MTTATMVLSNGTREEEHLFASTFDALARGSSSVRRPNFLSRLLGKTRKADTRGNAQSWQPVEEQMLINTFKALS